MWMGGNVPLGYDVKDRKLIANEIHRPNAARRSSGVLQDGLPE
jgi:hypothetical protein